MKKAHLLYVEFYITNVCNFNCRGCNRFNNYTFSGSQRWKDYSAIYRDWSHRLEFDRCTILGGEPMATADYMEWLSGIRELWPNARIEFLTNGSLLKPTNREFYDIFLQNKDNMTLSIGLHNRSRLQEVIDTVSKWLVGDIIISRFPENLHNIENSEYNWHNSYENIRDPSWPDCDTWDQWDELPDHIKKECSEVFDFDPKKFADRLQNYRLTDSQGVRVNVSWESDFHQGALIADERNQTFRLHNSDPIKAHSICHSKTCHHFESGKLYKCGQVSLFPQFYQQFFLDLTDEEIEIMHSYKPADLSMDDHGLKTWMKNINDPIAQCRFCPESHKTQEIFASTKKIIFPKKKKVDR
jgi:organic radical activating enzyme